MKKITKGKIGLKVLVRPNGTTTLSDVAFDKAMSAYVNSSNEWVAIYTVLCMPGMFDVRVVDGGKADFLLA